MGQHGDQLARTGTADQQRSGALGMVPQAAPESANRRAANFVKGLAHFAIFGKARGPCGLAKVMAGPLGRFGMGAAA